MSLRRKYFFVRAQLFLYEIGSKFNGTWNAWNVYSLDIYVSIACDRVAMRDQAYFRLLPNEPNPWFKSPPFRMSVKRVIYGPTILMEASEWWVLCMSLHRRLLKRFETFLGHSTGNGIRTLNLPIINQFCQNLDTSVSRIIVFLAGRKPNGLNLNTLSFVTVWKYFRTCSGTL